MKLIKIFLTLYMLCSSMFAASECENLLARISPQKDFREIFIIIDQTTSFPKKIRTNALRNIFSTIKGNTAVSLFTFSEYTKDKYVSFVDHYYIPGEISQDKRDNLGKIKLKQFDQCLAAQTYGMKRKLANDIYSQLFEENSAAKNSEILFSLQEISTEAVKISRAKEKIVFILSDMLENSSYTSFYGKKLKDLNINKQMDIVKKNHLFGNFDNAKIFVYGAGTVDKETRRTGEGLRRLKQFWQSYFQQSSGELKVFELDSIYQASEYL